MDKKDSFVFYRSFHEAIHKIKDKSLRADIYEAICELALNENTVELNEETGQIIMELIKPQIIANQERYANGGKGGRPKTINDQQIVELILDGKSNKEITEILKCGLTTVKNVRQKLVKNWSKSQKPNVNVNDNDLTTTATTNNNNACDADLFEVVREEFKLEKLSPMEHEIVEGWLSMELSNELILNAIRETKMNGVCSLKYVQSILNRYKREGINCVSDTQKNRLGELSDNHLEQKDDTTEIELFDYDWLEEE